MISPDPPHDDTGWRWVSVGAPDSARRIKIPPALRADGVFDRFDEVHWGYSLDSGAIVISAERLRLERYSAVEARAIGGAKDNYRAQLPHQFFPDTSGEAYLRMQKTDRYLEGSETFHFVYHRAITDEPVPYCFMLTTEQLERRLKPPAAWPGSVFSDPTAGRYGQRG